MNNPMLNNLVSFVFEYVVAPYLVERLPDGDLGDLLAAVMPRVTRVVHEHADGDYTTLKAAVLFAVGLAIREVKEKVQS